MRTTCNCNTQPVVFLAFEPLR